MSDEEGEWDLSLQIEGLSLWLRGLRLGQRASLSRPEPGSPSGSQSSFSLVSLPSRSTPEQAPTRVLSAERSSLDLPASPNPLQASGHSSLSGAQGCSSGALPQVSQAPLLPSSSTSVVPEYPLPRGGPSLDFSSPQRLALAFPSIPDSCVGLCRTLTGSDLNARERAERAWLAGCWAGAVWRAEVSRPDPSPALGLQSRFYCILRASGLERPVVVASLGAFRRIVGTDLGSSISHGFPSTSECRVFFAAAGLTYPVSLTR